MSGGHEGGNAGTSVQAGRDIAAPVVIGDNNLVFTAGASDLRTGRKPDPRRRKEIDRRPRPRHEPLAGRGALVGQLSAALRDGTPVQVYGPPGIGKSEILREAARTAEPRPDGLVFLSASSAEVRDLAQQLFEACYETAGYAPAVDDLRLLMAGVQVTVYVDNANFDGEQLRDIMDMAPAATFAFASPGPTLRGQGTVVEVTGLDVADGLSLLTREAGLPSLTEADQAAATELWEKAQGRPLLLVQAAGLARRAGAVPRPSEVAELTRLLLDEQDATGQEILHLLATLGGAEIAAAHVGALTGTPDPALACDSLVKSGLLMSDDGMYRCPPEVLPVIAGKYPQAYPIDRLCGHFTMWAASRTATPDQVARHAAAIAEAARLAQFTGRPDLAVLVTRAASPSMARALRFGPWGLILGRGWSAANASGDKRAEAYFTREEGNRAQLIGKVSIGLVLAGAAVEMLRALSELPVPQSPAVPLPPAAAPLAPVPAAPPAPAPSAPASPAPASPPGPGTTPASPGAHAAAPNGVAPHGVAATHAGATHAAVTVSGHMTALTSVPVWPGPPPMPAPSPAIGHPWFPHPGFPHPAGLQPGVHGHWAPAHAGHASWSKLPLLAKILIAIAAIAAVGGAGAVAINAASVQPPTGLAGTWQDASNGTGLTITAAGGGYTYQDNCHATVTLTGSGSTYTGQANAYPQDSSSCIPNGHVTVTFTLEDGGQQLVQNSAMPPGQTAANGGSLYCVTCGTFTYTRASSL